VKRLRGLALPGCNSRSQQEKGIVEEEKGLTTHRRVYAGGDAVTGTTTVILAAVAGAGKRVAAAIHEDLSEADERSWDDFLDWCRRDEHTQHE